MPDNKVLIRKHPPFHGLGYNNELKLRTKKSDFDVLYVHMNHYLGVQEVFQGSVCEGSRAVHTTYGL